MEFSTLSKEYDEVIDILKRMVDEIGLGFTIRIYDGSKLRIVTTDWKKDALKPKHLEEGLYSTLEDVTFYFKRVFLMWNNKKPSIKTLEYYVHVNTLAVIILDRYKLLHPEDSKVILRFGILESYLAAFKSKLREKYNDSEEPIKEEYTLTDFIEQSPFIEKPKHIGKPKKRETINLKEVIDYSQVILDDDDDINKKYPWLAEDKKKANKARKKFILQRENMIKKLEEEKNQPHSILNNFLNRLRNSKDDKEKTQQIADEMMAYYEKTPGGVKRRKKVVEVILKANKLLGSRGIVAKRSKKKRIRSTASDKPRTRRNKTLLSERKKAIRQKLGMKPEKDLKLIPKGNYGIQDDGSNKKMSIEDVATIMAKVDIKSKDETMDEFDDYLGGLLAKLTFASKKNDKTKLIRIGQQILKETHNNQITRDDIVSRNSIRKNYQRFIGIMKKHDISRVDIES